MPIGWKEGEKRRNRPGRLKAESRTDLADLLGLGYFFDATFILELSF